MDGNGRKNRRRMAAGLLAGSVLLTSAGSLVRTDAAEIFHFPDADTSEKGMTDTYLPDQMLQTVLQGGADTSKSEIFSLREKGEETETDGETDTPEPEKEPAAVETRPVNQLYAKAENQARTRIYADNPVLADGTQPVNIVFETVYTGGDGNPITRRDAASERKSGNIWLTEMTADRACPDGRYLTRVYASDTAGRQTEIGQVTYQLQAIQANETAVPQLLQNPELPTGCESVALTIALMSDGFSLQKTTIADKYLPYGDNYAISYVGNPYSTSGAGCFPPCIVSTANHYLRDQKSLLRARDITGTSLNDLYNYIDEGVPVIVWHTMHMASPDFTGQTMSYAGRNYPWYRSEHCIVLCGYDSTRGTVKVSDPLDGLVERDASAFAQIYKETGQFAVVIQ